jgi:hypothetical protein
MSDHTYGCHLNSSLLLNIRFSDSEAARVKNATRLVGGFASSTLELQDGISKMAG